MLAGVSADYNTQLERGNVNGVSAPKGPPVPGEAPETGVGWLARLKVHG